MQLNSPKTIAEVFERDCPYYMSIGMTYEQYWFGDVTMVRAFREADKLRRKRLNQEQWIMGHYIYDAILSVAPVLRAFAKKNTKPIPYHNKPFPLFEEDKADQISEEEKKQIAENERLRAILFFRNWAKSVEKNQKSKM